MKQKYFTPEQKKEARKKWNRKYYLRNKMLIQMAKRQLLEQEKQKQNKNTKV